MKNCMTMQNILTITGYVAPLPRAADEKQARVAIMQDETEYRIIPRGAGVDLDDHLSALVEVTGSVTETEGVLHLVVRGYRVLEDDDAWINS